MVWPRYIAYFVGITLLTWLLTQLEVSFPGSLRMHVMNPGDHFGTSEYSPIEIIQPIIIAVCGLLMLWVAEYCPTQRPIAIPFGGLALAFMIRELDYFLDRYLAQDRLGAHLAISGSGAAVCRRRHPVFIRPLRRT
jgi:hypothetical protein